jgi:hypothetical protein
MLEIEQLLAVKVERLINNSIELDFSEFIAGFLLISRLYKVAGKPVGTELKPLLATYKYPRN